MPVKVYSASNFGAESILVDIEVDATPGLRFFNIVGLPSKVVEESKDRIAAAIRNCGFIPYSSKNKRIIVNLAPASVKKEGPLFDLPIALGYLLATSQLDFNPQGKIIIGELSLDGTIKPVNGVLPIIIFSKNAGFKEIIVPSENVKEAALIKGVKIFGVPNLRQVITHLTGENPIKPAGFSFVSSNVSHETPGRIDISEIKGQESAKNALLISAAGGHNMLMFGPPGSGKTLLVKALVSILPKMDYGESLEVTKLFSISGLLNNSFFIESRPFRSPHHTTSSSAIIGGGTIPKPGEISLAHKGVLFLDELPEFPRNVLEALRQPLEDGYVTVSRSAGTVKFPAEFTLIAAMNPCPCGNFGSDKLECSCPPQSVTRYQRKVSGPLLDRIDLHVNVPRETFEKISGNSESEKVTNSSEIVKKVEKIRKIQTARFGKIKTNSNMNMKDMERFCVLDNETKRFLAEFIDKKNLSARSYHKILKVSRTIADLEENENIKISHIAQALNYRFSEEIGGLL